MTTTVINIHLPQFYCNTNLVDVCKEYGLSVLNMKTYAYD